MLLPPCFHMSKMTTFPQEMDMGLPSTRKRKARKRKHSSGRPPLPPLRAAPRRRRLNNHTPLLVPPPRRQIASATIEGVPNTDTFGPDVVLVDEQPGSRTYTAEINEVMAFTGQAICDGSFVALPVSSKFSQVSTSFHNFPQLFTTFFLRTVNYETLGRRSLLMKEDQMGYLKAVGIIDPLVGTLGKIQVLIRPSPHHRVVKATVAFEPNLWGSNGAMNKVRIIVQLNLLRGKAPKTVSLTSNVSFLHFIFLTFCQLAFLGIGSNPIGDPCGIESPQGGSN